jgi:hypothetical protein
VEELIEKAQILLGDKIMRQNLQDEIALSPMNTTINQAEVTLMMDGGWNKRASGKAYIIVPLVVRSLLVLEQEGLFFGVIFQTLF